MANDDLEERIDKAARLREEIGSLQEMIDASEREIEELLNIENLPYDFQEMIELLRKTTAKAQ